MKKAFPKRLYKQRWQVESAFSRFKRVLTPVLHGRSWSAQQREVHLRVLTYNYMIMGELL